MRSELLMAINLLAAEKGLPRDVVLRTAEQAMATAIKKDNVAVTQPLVVRINPTTGDMGVFLQRYVVEEVTDPDSEFTLEDARRSDPAAQVGDTLEEQISIATGAGRIAAQTAKQVLLQRLREAEHNAVFEEFHTKEGDVLTGIIQRVELKQIILDLGRGEAVLPGSEQVRTERYRPGQRIKVYLLEVQRSPRGTQVVVSRTHRNLLRRLLELEVPELQQGIVEIKAIAREPGSRSKLAVYARQTGIDPVGCCVGQRGIRIQGIVRELGGERIDVVVWDDDSSVFIHNALSPAQVLSVNVKEEEKTAEVVVPDRQLSLAIGKEGQNARLAAKLTGWRIDIKSSSVAEADKLVLKKPAASAAAAPEAPKVVVGDAVKEGPPAEVPAAEQPVVPVAEVEMPAEVIPEQVTEIAPEPVGEVVEQAVEVVEEVAEETVAEVIPVVEEVVVEEKEETEEETEEEALSFEEVFTKAVPTQPTAPGGLRFAEDIPELRRGGQGGGRRRREETRGKKAKK
ncbi:MAG: transcription termination factor NusA, partial [Dehalococcoidia bacterium]|nr:transcription termination factor NusA [Dehalococcoidia bacterium]